MSFLLQQKKIDLFHLAVDLDEQATDKMTKIVLQNLIVGSKNYNEDSVKDLLKAIIAERIELEKKLDDENKVRLEKEERENKYKIDREHQLIKEREDKEFKFKMEKEKLSVELERMRFELQQARSNSGTIQNGDENSRGKSLDETVKMIRLLTVNIPSKAEGWNYFFSSLENAFANEKVTEEIKPKVLLCLLGDKVANLIVNADEDKLKNYDLLKELVLKEYEPSPKLCLENFRRARRNSEETFSQFASRLMSMWLYYCKMRGATDFESVNNLVVADKMFQTLDHETSTHVGILQGENWFKPKELGKNCDIFYSSKGKSYDWSAKNKGVNNDKNNVFGAAVKHQTNDKKVEYSKFTPWKNDDREKESKKFACFLCGSDKHLKRNCPKNKIGGNSGLKVNNVSAEGIERKSETVAAKVDLFGEVIPKGEIADKLNKLERTSISIDGKLVEALVDSGTEITVVKKELVPEISVEGASTIYLKGIFGPAVKCPLVYVPIGLATGGRVNVMHQQVLCALAEALVEEVLLPPDVLNMLGGARNDARIFQDLRLNSGGIDEEAVDYADSSRTFQELRINSGGIDEEAVDYADSSRTFQGGKSVNNNNLERYEKVISNLSKVGTNAGGDNEAIADADNGNRAADKFRSEQENCVDLDFAWKCAKEGKGNYYEVNGYLFHKDKILGESIGQLVLPKCRRKEVLQLAHTSVFSSHMGLRKTLERIKYSFFWEGLRADIKKFCESCKECQLTKTVKTRDRAPITPVARPELPFQVVNVDLIGPIDPPSSKGHKYILCLVDQHTRWGEAVPLTSLNAKATCEALLSIFSRTGIPNVIASDNGTNFNAELTKEFEKRIGSCPRFSTPAYPQSNGLVERFNRTLKRMLHNVIREEGRGWHLQIPYVLWAYREIPNTTTGVSPFQLLYGRQPQGPLSILKSTWTGKHNNLQLDTTPVFTYLENLKLRLEKAAEQAKLVSEVQQEKTAHYYNLRSSDKVFSVGEKVIVLIPDSNNKLYARWQGPATIVEKRNPHSFIVKMQDGSTKHIHQNKLRHYVARANAVNVIFEEESDFGNVETLPTSTKDSNFFEILNKFEFHYLNNSQLHLIKNLIVEFKRIFTRPVQPAQVGSHKIELIPGAERKRPHCYSVPIAYRKEVERQVRELIDLNLIEPSESEIAHPIVCVAKRDSTVRMCIDFRALNAVTKVPTFPMKDMQELIFIAGAALWLTSLDLQRGYWQIRMEENSKHLTAFATHNAVYQWQTMPFGLSGASGTFQREMNRVLASHSEYAQAYMDDVIIFSKTFEEHMNHLRLIFSDLDKLGFSVRIDKCTFATDKIKYLGHVIGGGNHGPDEEKVATIRKLARPTTKKEVRSVLGLMGFYRTYIPNYAEVSAPLSDLTKKNKPNVISWGETERASFDKLKKLLCEVTCLSTPNTDLPFQVHCDASDYGVGSCLTQQDSEGNYKPIAFASQKLTPTQRNWASIEKEAWAVLFGLNKFDKWIYGSRVEIISDHNPLKYLNETSPKSPKLIRWALALQRWNQSITHRRGVHHKSADALSRLN